MAGFNQLLLAGNLWPIGAITHLLTKAQGNYKLRKYTHDAGALDSMVLTEFGQETVFGPTFLSFNPLLKSFHISLISQDGSTEKLWSAKAVSSSPEIQTTGFSLPCTPLQPLKIITLILIFRNASRLPLWFYRFLTQVSYSAFGAHYWLNQLAKLGLLISRKWRETCQGNKWGNNYSFMSLWKNMSTRYP